MLSDVLAQSHDVSFITGQVPKHVLSTIENA